MAPIWTTGRREDNAGTRPCSSASNLGWNWGRSGIPDFRRIPAQHRRRTAINPDDGTRSAFLVRKSLPVPGKCQRSLSWRLELFVVLGPVGLGG